MNFPHRYSDIERDVVYSVISERRDMRHFLPDSIVDETVLQRLLQAAHSAPSVGLMQPWRFIRMRDASLREAIAAMVEEERALTAQAMGEREAEFMRLKVEGLRECAELLAVVLAPDDGTVFGRRTMPEEMALCSAACAIQNLWLAARAENLGMGWVSLFDPQRLASLLNCPQGAKPIALLCLGPVSEFYPRPMLEQLGWRQGKPLEVMQDGWSASC
ncbi:MAG TPA: 5,6-dimethylbenzimidazole synthase [Gallionella sp.]|nr:5,6-dimethylbenzimidazole synthase [Gallionella sp.]